MPLAITLRLDAVSAASIGDIWRDLAAEQIDADCHQLGYPAHITLAICPDEVSTDRLLPVIAKTVRQWRVLPVTIDGIGIFPGATSTVWAAPVVSVALLAMHANLAEAMSGLPVHPHYRADRWMPHVTLTGPIADPALALKVLLPRWRPIAGTLVQLDVVRFRPVEVLSSQLLIW
jgi:2'-5' RNA ligase